MFEAPPASKEGLLFSDFNLTTISKSSAETLNAKMDATMQRMDEFAEIKGLLQDIKNSQSKMSIDITSLKDGQDKITDVLEEHSKMFNDLFDIQDENEFFNPKNKYQSYRAYVSYLGTNVTKDNLITFAESIKQITNIEGPNRT